MATDGSAHEGQIAVVTGAAQGLGLGIAQYLAQGGAQVVMVDLQDEKVTAAAAEVVAAGGQGTLSRRGSAGRQDRRACQQRGAWSGRGGDY